MLNPNLSEPLQVLHKLEREMHRAFHHQNYTHKSDHFFNFCITALSLKDYVLSYMGLTEDSDKQPFHDEWAQEDYLRAATEIGNTVKHCGLKKLPRTKSVERARSNVINVHINSGGDIKEIKENVPDYMVSLEDGNDIHLYEFTSEIIDYWKNYLQRIGIEYVPQDENTFFGDAET